MTLPWKRYARLARNRLYIERRTNALAHETKLKDQEKLIEFLLQSSIYNFGAAAEMHPLDAWHDGRGTAFFESARSIASDVYGFDLVDKVWPDTQTWRNSMMQALRKNGDAATGGV